MAEAISIHRKIESDAVSFHFGVQFTVRYHLASSAVEEVGGLLLATALLTEDGVTAEDFDFRTLAGRFGAFSHSGSGANYKDYKLYRNSVRLPEEFTPSCRSRRARRTVQVLLRAPAGDAPLLRQFARFHDDETLLIAVGMVPDRWFRVKVGQVRQWA